MLMMALAKADEQRSVPRTAVCPKLSNVEQRDWLHLSEVNFFASDLCEFVKFHIFVQQSNRPATPSATCRMHGFLSSSDRIEGSKGATAIRLKLFPGAGRAPGDTPLCAGYAARAGGHTTLTGLGRRGVRAPGDIPLWRGTGVGGHTTSRALGRVFPGAGGHTTLTGLRLVCVRGHSIFLCGVVDLQLPIRFNFGRN